LVPPLLLGLPPQLLELLPPLLLGLPPQLLELVPPLLLELLAPLLLVPAAAAAVSLGAAVVFTGFGGGLGASEGGTSRFLSFANELSMKLMSSPAKYRQLLRFGSNIPLMT
jgi:hypothetical protein